MFKTCKPAFTDRLRVVIISYRHRTNVRILMDTRFFVLVDRVCFFSFHLSCQYDCKNKLRFKNKIETKHASMAHSIFHEVCFALLLPYLPYYCLF